MSERDVSPSRVPALVFQAADSDKLSNIPDLQPPEFLDDVEEESLDNKPNFLDSGVSLYRVPSPTLSVTSDSGSERQFANPKLTSEYLSKSPVLGASNGFQGRMSRHATHMASTLYGSPQLNNSSSSIGKFREKRSSFNNGQYIPGPVLPPRGPSPTRARSPVRMRSPSPTRYRPFNFNSMSMQPNQSLQPGQKATFRRGHRYKHSSVSMNLFQEPPAKSPINIPKSHPIPTLGEAVASLTRTQRAKLAAAALHCSLAGLTNYLGFSYNNLCLSTLSHLVFYDSWGNVLLVAVLVMKNFDCWSSSSLVYPFGLGRIEVLVGFALSVSLLFVGGDLISHLVEELIISIIAGGAASAHTHHVHEDATQLRPLFYEVYLALVCVVTVGMPYLIDLYRDAPSANLDTSALTAKDTSSLKPKARVSKLFSSFTARLTLGYALFSMAYPLLHGTPYAEMTTQFSTFILALTTCTVSWKLIVSLSKILLIAYPYGQKNHQQTTNAIREQVMALDVFKSAFGIEDILISKVNYKIYVIVVTIKAPGATEDDESKLRFYSTKIVKRCVLDAENSELVGKFERSTDSTALLETDAIDTLDNTGEKFEITIDIQRA